MAYVNGVKRVGSISIRSNKGTPVVEETYEYDVVADYVGQPLLEIANADGLPTVNVSPSSGGLTICRSKEGKMVEGKATRFVFTCSFSSEVEENSEDNSDQNTPPDTWVPIYETKFERMQEVVAKDQSGTTIANSAGQPFDTGLTITRFIPIWTFYQFEPATVTDEQIIARNEVVNSGTFKGRAAKTLLCTVESSTIGFFYGRRLRLTYYALKYNVKKWTHKRLDIGYRWKKNGSANLIPQESASAVPIALDGSGRPASGYDGSTDNPGLTVTAPSVLEFDMYATNTFSFLRI